jgi:hypothetical protein
MKDILPAPNACTCGRIRSSTSRAEPAWRRGMVGVCFSGVLQAGDERTLEDIYVYEVSNRIESSAKEVTVRIKKN